ncbi:MAG: 30S ribosomal protein S9 [Parcubacteria group bacterium RIFCSPHIGHO2_01_FULL_56_18]|nr:MAG: 30S ribosomal protein S9 [Parcubacteria group bacterium RIFCSPHIGHO2_01_FULL_56_18]
MSEKYFGLGRRKTAVARVQLSAGSGKHTINETPFENYFTTIDMRQAALQPLVLSSQLGAWQINARVTGGGKRAQADAVKLGVARALVAMDGASRKQLKVAGVLTRDPRVKERKKPGLRRARRAPQFSKR